MSYFLNFFAVNLRKRHYNHQNLFPQFLYVFKHITDLNATKQLWEHIGANKRLKK